jgi:predicted enzyme related to lactoylglutathione lyase
VSTGKAPGAGIYKRPPEAPAGWAVYVGVKDAAAMAEKAKALGATVVQERTLISPEHGHFAVLRDPTGAAICLHEAPAMKPKKARRPARKARRAGRARRR